MAVAEEVSEDVVEEVSDAGELAILESRMSDIKLDELAGSRLDVEADSDKAELVELVLTMEKMPVVEVVDGPLRTIAAYSHSSAPLNRSHIKQRDLPFAKVKKQNRNTEARGLIFANILQKGACADLFAQWKRTMASNSTKTKDTRARRSTSCHMNVIL